MEYLTVEPGRVVTSLQGRDRSRSFVVLSVVDDQYVMMADGCTRKLDHPKKKKRKHLHVRPVLIPGIREKPSARQLLDSDVRKALEAAGYGMRQPLKEG